jgi:hypothetical protein
MTPTSLLDSGWISSASASTSLVSLPCHHHSLLGSPPDHLGTAHLDNWIASSSLCLKFCAAAGFVVALRVFLIGQATADGSWLHAGSQLSLLMKFAWARPDPLRSAI